MTATAKQIDHNARAAQLARQALSRRREALLLLDQERSLTERDEESATGAVLRLLSPAEECELRNIEAALIRIEQGRWGLCGLCGHAIGYQLLRALPERTVCVGCEHQAEDQR